MEILVGGSSNLCLAGDFQNFNAQSVLLNSKTRFVGS